MGVIGVIVLFSYVLYQFIQNKKYETVGYLVFALILVGLTARTIVRNLDWRTMDHLSIATARTSPSDPKTHNNMGDVYAKRGDFQKAAESFALATQLNPRYADAYHNLANTYKDMGKFDLAIQNYNKALEINPDIWQTYQGLGVVYYLQKDMPKALEYMEKAKSMYPIDSGLRTNLGIMYLEVGKKDLARQEFTEALKLNPNNQKAALGIQEVNK
ncbi:MAG: tetratricopeptide repeat protein [Desulfobacterales bacterium]|nr:tetratricopeptide repeat protein [Desulfobacterales bacterium]